MLIFGALARLFLEGFVHVDTGLFLNGRTDGIRAFRVCHTLVLFHELVNGFHHLPIVGDGILVALLCGLVVTLDSFGVGTGCNCIDCSFPYLVVGFRLGVTFSDIHGVEFHLSHDFVLLPLGRCLVRKAFVRHHLTIDSNGLDEDIAVLVRFRGVPGNGSHGQLTACEDIVCLSSCALAHIRVLHEAFHSLVAVKLRVLLQPLLAHVLNIGFGNVKVHGLPVSGCWLVLLLLLLGCACEEDCKVAIAVLLQLLSLLSGECHVARTRIHLLAQLLHKAHAVVVALLHGLGVLNRAQPCNDARGRLHHVLGFEADHHRHVVRPHVHGIPITANPFGNGEYRTLGNGRGGKFSCTDTHLTSSA